VDATQNLIVNPLYCDADGFDYRVAANSSCAPGGPHGQIGALGVGCDPQVVSVDPGIRTALAIGQVAPNPLVGGSEVTVFFTLPRGESATMDILDAGGRRVATHPRIAAGVGDHRVQLRVGDLPPGIYWLRVAQAGQAASSKVCVLP
jgi:hypothetical protein